MVHHRGAEGAERKFENVKLCVLCVSAVSPSFYFNRILVNSSSRLVSSF
jgi:hypothetical protein